MSWSPATHPSAKTPTASSAPPQRPTSAPRSGELSIDQAFWNPIYTCICYRAFWNSIYTLHLLQGIFKSNFHLYLLQGNPGQGCDARRDNSSLEGRQGYLPFHGLLHLRRVRSDSRDLSGKDQPRSGLEQDVSSWLWCLHGLGRSLQQHQGGAKLFMLKIIRTNKKT